MIRHREAGVPARSTRVVTGILALGGLLLAACSSAAGSRPASPAVALADCGQPPQARPAIVAVICSTNSITVRDLRWSAWGRRRSGGGPHARVLALKPSPCPAELTVGTDSWPSTAEVRQHPPAAAGGPVRPAQRSTLAAHVISGHEPRRLATARKPQPLAPRGASPLPPAATALAARTRRGRAGRRTRRRPIVAAVRGLACALRQRAW